MSWAYLLGEMDRLVITVEQWLAYPTSVFSLVLAAILTAHVMKVALEILPPINPPCRSETVVIVLEIIVVVVLACLTRISHRC